MWVWMCVFPISDRYKYVCVCVYPHVYVWKQVICLYVCPYTFLFCLCVCVCLHITFFFLERERDHMQVNRGRGRGRERRGLGAEHRAQRGLISGPCMTWAEIQCTLNQLNYSGALLEPFLHILCSSGLCLETSLSNRVRGLLKDNRFHIFRAGFLNWCLETRRLCPVSVPRGWMIKYVE